MVTAASAMLLLWCRQIYVRRRGRRWHADIVAAVAAVSAEAAWEAYENTDTVINRYRTATVALGYYGDSVLNSMSDILACMVGFLLASRLRWWWTAAWVVTAEVVVAIVIRDNLTLNILMLVWPVEAIKRWQSGA